MQTGIPQGQVGGHGRTAALRAALEARRRQLMQTVSDRQRDAQADVAVRRDVRDEVEQSDDALQDGIVAAVSRMEADVLALMRLALRRLDDGTYGLCGQCGEEIAENRLRAVPFALHCRACEESHERAALRLMQKPRLPFASLGDIA